MPLKLHWPRYFSPDKKLYFDLRANTAPIEFDLDMDSLVESLPFGRDNTLFWVASTVGITYDEIIALIKKPWWVLFPDVENKKFATFEKWQSELIVDAFEYADTEMELFEQRTVTQRNQHLRSYIELNLEVYKAHEFTDV